MCYRLSPLILLKMSRLRFKTRKVSSLPYIYIYIHIHIHIHIYIHTHTHTVVNIWTGSKMLIKVVLRQEHILVLGPLWWKVLIPFKCWLVYAHLTALHTLWQKADCCMYWIQESLLISRGWSLLANSWRMDAPCLTTTFRRLVNNGTIIQNFRFIAFPIM